MNIQKQIDNLVKGLEQEGKFYNITSKRFRSKNVNRYVTKYTITEQDNKENIMEVYNKLEILKFLVREYCKTTGRPIPESCLEALE